MYNNLMPKNKFYLEVKTNKGETFIIRKQKGRQTGYELLNSKGEVIVFMSEKDAVEYATESIKKVEN